MAGTGADPRTDGDDRLVDRGGPGVAADDPDVEAVAVGPQLVVDERERTGDIGHGRVGEHLGDPGLVATVEDDVGGCPWPARSRPTRRRRRARPRR